MTHIKRILPVVVLVVLTVFAKEKIKAQEIKATVLTGHRESQSRANEYSRFVNIKNLAFTDNEGTEGIAIEVDESERRQTYYGMGTSFDRTSMGNLLKMSPEIRSKILHWMFAPVGPGIELNIIRYPFGTSDFTHTEWYTYNDLPKGETDPELKKFSIERDRELGFIDLLHEVMKINPDIRLVGATWSPPAWMKVNGRLIRGSDLKEEYRPVFAAYLRKTLQAFAAEGIVFDGITIQNEPEVNQVYPSCTMATETILAVQAALRKELDEHDIAVEVWTGDTQWNEMEKYQLPQAEAARENNNPYVTGAAWHFYGGGPRQMRKYAEQFPEHRQILTEIQLTNSKRGNISRALEFFQYGANGMIDWITAMDREGGPNNPGNPWDVSGGRFFTMDRQNPNDWNWARNFYQYGAVSPYLEPGAVLIESPMRKKHLRTAAFQNPDGEIVLFIASERGLNDDEMPASAVTVGWNGKTETLEVPGEEFFLSLRWYP